MNKGNNTSKEEDLQWKDELKISMWNISASTDLMIYVVNGLFSSVLVHFFKKKETNSLVLFLVQTLKKNGHTFPKFVFVPTHCSSLDNLLRKLGNQQL